MLHSIPDRILERMKFLEAADARDRIDGTDRYRRLRQIPPETGRFLALLAAGTPDGNVLEIGASAGYSTLWIILGCEPSHRVVTTMEILPEKAALARETFRLAGVESRVKLVEGDARSLIPAYRDIAFCFLDAEKDAYGEYYELIVPRLVRGGLLVADNAISHGEELRPVLDRAMRDERVDALIVPIGKGELVCRKT